MNIEEYYSKIYKLSFIQRYANIARIRNEDVAQHSFFVSAIILKLYDNYSFNLGIALQAAVCHDITEADLSDVTHQVKHDYPQLAAEIKKVEIQVVCNYPDAVIEGFKVFEDESSVEGLIANLADVMQVSQYIDNEISLGNKNVFDIRIEATKRIHTLRQRLSRYERCRKDGWLNPPDESRRS